MPQPDTVTAQPKQETQPPDSVSTPQTRTVDTGIDQMGRDLAAAWPGVFGTTTLHELGHAGTADILGTGVMPDPDDPEAVWNTVTENTTGSPGEIAADTPDTLGEVKDILTENEAYDVAGDWENTNLGDGPLVETLEETSLLADNDSYSWEDGVTDPLNRDNAFGYAQYTGADQNHWFVDAATTAGSWIQGLLPPLLTAWADDNEKKLGRRLGATASATIAAEQAVTGYHLGPVAAALGTSTAAVCAAVAAPFLALVAYNGKKLHDRYTHLQKQEDLGVVVEALQEDPDIWEDVEETWREYVTETFDEEELEDWNPDNMQFIDALEYVNEIQEEYNRLREERSLLDKLNPCNWSERTLRKHLEETEDALLETGAAYMDDHAEQVQEYTNTTAEKNPGEYSEERRGQVTPRRDPPNTDVPRVTAA